jgi:hypothetical protein
MRDGEASPVCPGKPPDSCWLIILTYFSTLNMEAVCSSETSMNLYLSALRYIAEWYSSLSPMREPLMSTAYLHSNDQLLNPVQGK